MRPTTIKVASVLWLAVLFVLLTACITQVNPDWPPLQRLLLLAGLALSSGIIPDACDLVHKAWRCKG